MGQWWRAKKRSPQVGQVKVIDWVLVLDVKEQKQGPRATFYSWNQHGKKVLDIIHYKTLTPMKEQTPQYGTWLYCDKLMNVILWLPHDRSIGIRSDALPNGWSLELLSVTCTSQEPTKSNRSNQFVERYLAWQPLGELIISGDWKYAHLPLNSRSNIKRPWNATEWLANLDELFLPKVKAFEKELNLSCEKSAGGVTKKDASCHLPLWQTWHPSITLMPWPTWPSGGHACRPMYPIQVPSAWYIHLPAWSARCVFKC